MKINKITESVLRRLLRESREEREERGRRRLSQAENMAVLIKRVGEKSTIILYDPITLIRLIDQVTGRPESGSSINLAIERVILGVIETVKPRAACNGAREVKISAVKHAGDGGILYGLAFAASPNGILTPDRHSVSARAQAGWGKQASRDGQPFDDAEAPPWARRTPDDPSDDCRLHRDGDACGSHADLDVLNRSYESEGWEDALLARLSTTHAKVLNILTQREGEAAVRLLLKSADDFFMEQYHN